MGKISPAAVYGVHAYEAEIEVNGGDPTIAILWLPDGAAKEGRERVATAIATSEYFWQRGRTTINLALVDIKKERPSFD